MGEVGDGFKDPNTETKQAADPTPEVVNTAVPEKSKIAAGLFCLLLGDIGVGNFYLGKIGLGIVDLLFCWTAVPGIVNFIRGIMILCQSDESFEQKYHVRASK